MAFMPENPVVHQKSIAPADQILIATSKFPLGFNFYRANWIKHAFPSPPI
jgi:hypothetical protein